jgi:hypothetical protein
MRIWKTIEVNETFRQADAVSDLLGDWLREALATAPVGPIEVETNIGGYDEAGYLSPDFEWAEPIVREFPHLQVRVRYRLPRTRHEATQPYEVIVRWGTTGRRAWLHVDSPSRWIILQE